MCERGGGFVATQGDDEGKRGQWRAPRLRLCRCGPWALRRFPAVDAGVPQCRSAGLRRPERSLLGVLQTRPHDATLHCRRIAGLVLTLLRNAYCTHATAHSHTPRRRTFLWLPAVGAARHDGQHAAALEKWQPKQRPRSHNQAIFFTMGAHQCGC